MFSLWLNASLNVVSNGNAHLVVSAFSASFTLFPSHDTGVQAAKVKKLLTSPEYSGADSYGKMVATAYRMNWTDIGLSPVDMQIIESEKWDAIMLCNIYGVPPELLGLTQKTYNNVKEAIVTGI